MALTIKELYTYAQLAGAGYVDLTGLADFTDTRLIRRANAKEPLERIPTSLGTQFFQTDGWRVLGDPRQLGVTNGAAPTLGSPKPVMVHTDPTSGFAATLFQRGTAGEKVLSVRGTDPAGDNQIVQDLLDADINEIGGLGMAFKQTVSLFNLVQRMLAAPGQTGVFQLAAKSSIFSPPTGGAACNRGQTTFSKMN